MITFILYALSTILNEPVPGTVYWLTSLVDGLAFIPLLTLVGVPIAGRFAREKMGRLHYLQSVFPMDEIALVLSPRGYEFAPVLDGEAVLANGVHLELGDEATWYRLGNRPLAVTFVPDESVLRDVIVDPADIEYETMVVEADGGREEAVWASDGERCVLRKQRGGFQGYTTILDHDVDGFVISLSRAINGLRGGGGVRLSEFTERMTRMEYGGGASLSNKARAIAFIGTIFIGSLFGTLILGVL